MTPELLRRVGVALYGDTWPSAMARALNIGTRSIRYWQAAEREVPVGIIVELADLCERQGRELTEVAKLLRKDAGATFDREMNAAFRVPEE